MKTAGPGVSRFSLAAKNSSLAATAAPPSRAAARSTRWEKSDTGITIHDAAAGVCGNDAAAQPAAGIGRPLVALPQRRLVDDELGLGIPDDEIGVHTGRDRSLAPVERGEPCR